jgi:hypothetical protein
MLKVHGCLNGENDTQQFADFPHRLLLVRIQVEFLQNVVRVAPNRHEIHKRGRV